jgi:hypothetical protein
MAMTMGMLWVARLAAKAAGVPWVMMTSTLRPTQLRGERGEPVEPLLGPAVLDEDVLALDEPQLP